MVKKRLLLGIAIAAVIASPIAAQTPPPAPSPGITQGGGSMTSPDEMEDYMRLRIERVKAGLKLNQEQEKFWPTVENAMRESAKVNVEFAQQARRDSEHAPDTDLISGIRWKSQQMESNAVSISKRAAAEKRFADALEPLYKNLDNDQKKNLTGLLKGLQPPQATQPPQGSQTPR
jgi:hypothetical protein